MEAPKKTMIFAFALASAFTTAAFAQSVGEKTGEEFRPWNCAKTDDFIKEAPPASPFALMR